MPFTPFQHIYEEPAADVYDAVKTVGAGRGGRWLPAVTAAPNYTRGRGMDLVPLPTTITNDAPTATYAAAARYTPCLPPPPSATIICQHSGTVGSPGQT